MSGKRRYLALACTGAMLLGGCAAGRAPAGRYDLYFREADLTAAPGGDALRAEQRLLTDAPAEPAALAAALIGELLAGPVDLTLENPIPQGTSLLSLELEGTRAEVDLSLHYRALSGVELALADYAITLTLTQLPEISAVAVTVRGQELDYRSSQVFAPRDVLFSSNEDVIGTLPVMLYFLTEDGRLAAEERTLDLYEGDTQVSAVVQALGAGPEDRELRPILPEGFRVKSVWLEEDTCYVNLSSALLPELGEGADMPAALRALARSLCSLEAVMEVRFLVDGEFAETYGPADISQPFVL